MGVFFQMIHFFLSSYHPQQLFGMFKAKKYEIIFKAEH